MMIDAVMDIAGRVRSLRCLAPSGNSLGDATYYFRSPNRSSRPETTGHGHEYYRRAPALSR
ncbi:MAG: hypothetical protein AVDCRST_MAG33-1990 [uncultured Thermomicrobiales bacterium]|uniref:Uncharacterized protein n=1 Tax=uncultured Thermomicrobiales bacterium TaxID=1645740 RepID=A0A6J4UZ10_9BACT|nr:MAG: hypothetical protein AVDCRST_MAG33-1990 [uncultured Thermomicrobiales bacterium]